MNMTADLRTSTVRRAIATVCSAGTAFLLGCASDAGPIDPSLDPFGVREVRVSPGVDTIYAADSVRLTDRLQLTARINGVGGRPIEGARAVWYSEDSTVAVVSEFGVVRPLRYGTVRIVASAAKKAYATVVIAPAVRRVTLTPSLDTIFVRDPILPGDTRRLTAFALDDSSRVVTGSRLEWLSATPAIATVDSTGLVRAISPGSAVITVRSAGASGTATFVVAPIHKAIVVSSTVTQALALDTIQLSATALDYSDRPVASTYKWTTSNASVATVDATGRVLAVAPGTVNITASGNFRSGSVTLAFFERQLLNVQTGEDYSCGTAPLGRLYCWGRGELGQLATPADSACFDESGVRNCALAPKRHSGPILDLRHAATGGDFACALSDARMLYCWGGFSEGQIGDGGLGGGSTPTLATVSTVRFDSVTTGGQHGCALTSAGAAYCWGSDRFGQLGDRRQVNSTTPIPVYGGHAFRSISAGGAHTCGIRTDGQAMCWGDNSRGQLGNGGSGGIIDAPVPVVSGGPFLMMSAGFQHTCALAANGRALCWGDNSRGQLGNGATSSVPAVVPTAVQGTLNFVSISAGKSVVSTGNLQANRSHTCAISTDASAYCWGDNYWRQSGSDDASIGTLNAPNLISSSTSGGFRTISTGWRHSCAYGNNGTAWCWGSNVYGSLGNELQAAGRHVPQQVVRPR